MIICLPSLVNSGLSAAFTGSTSNALGVTLLGMLYDATGSYYTNLILTLILQGSVILITLNLLRRKKAAQA